MSVFHSQALSRGVDAPSACLGGAGRGDATALAHLVNLSIRAEDEIPVADSTSHHNQLVLVCHELNVMSVWIKGTARQMIFVLQIFVSAMSLQTVVIFLCLSS